MTISIMIRIYYQQQGGHIHTRWFGSGSCNGTLVFDEREWELFRGDITACPHIVIVPEP